MSFYQEVTDWGPGTTNHVYLLSSDKTKMIAYVPFGNGAVFTFKRPIRIYMSGRKFIPVPNTWKYVTPSEGNVTKVAGSNGAVYNVTENNGKYTCSCPGFLFRGKCKHTTPK